MAETKLCKKCSNNFEITDQDLNFYSEVSPVFNNKKYLIPPPTFCPDCRQQRRLTWRNERTLYMRKCDGTGKLMVTVFSPDKPFAVYDNEYWHSDNWNSKNYAQDFDLTKTFFQQYSELMHKVPQIARSAFMNQNCDFVNQCAWSKNSYLIFEADCNENCLYSNNLFDSKTCVDTLHCTKCELCYECTNCRNCYNLKYSQNCETCTDSWFLKNCIGCSNCFGSVNLRNKQYYFFNKQYTKEEYNNKLAQFQLHTRKGIEHTKKQFLEFAKKFPHKYMNGIQNEDSTGDYLYNTKNCYECFDVNQGRDCKFVYNSRNTKNVYDMTVFGALKGVEFCYENHEIGESIRNTCFSDQIWTGASNIYYSKLCSGGCNDLFGCVGLRKSSYCILNKQYTKEEYGKLVPKIIEHMQQTGEWGEFPPASLSPFGYNETVAQEYFPLTKVEILKQEFNWSDFEAPKPSAKKIIKANEIPDEIKNISDDILENALECEVTGKLFRIVQQELQFYRKQNLPLPSKHHDQRHKERMALRNKRKLYNRSCKKCEITIQTTYATDRPEAIFCEKCYLENVN